jgi:hypothetical protein
LRIVPECRMNAGDGEVSDQLADQQRPVAGGVALLE